jgi:hypothetical protein
MCERIDDEQHEELTTVNFLTASTKFNLLVLLLELPK